MIERADHDLAFLLRYENVAWYENGKVRILDRRIYPQVNFVECSTYGDVAAAIRDMVTQSAGPYMAAGMGMALACYEAKNMGRTQSKDFLVQASYDLSHARPTTTARMEIITRKCLDVAFAALESGEDAANAVFEHTVSEINAKYERMDVTASYLVDSFPKKGSVLTQCFGETIVGMMLRNIRKQGKDIKIICAETRPYFQGARLTASVAVDQGFDTTVISDNMVAYAMHNKMIDVFTSAADAITMNGYVVNKVGTLQIAILCKYFDLPYFATGAPDKAHPDISSVKIEMRDPAFTLQAMGIRTAKEGVKGLYPAFDATPPQLIAGIVTNKGVFKPEEIYKYFD